MTTDSGVATRSVISSTLAPLLLIGGWTLAAAHQPPGFNSSVDTISALAGYGAADRWIMTLALLGLGVCHLVTASGLWAARAGGRRWLAAGGAATIAVECFPLPAVGASVAHAVAAGAAFISLSIWPLWAWVPVGAHHWVAWALRRGPSIAAATILIALLACFVALQVAGTFVGGSERIVAGAQAMWPLVVAWTIWLSRRP